MNAAISSSFFSSTIVCPLPWIPTVPSSTQVFVTPAWVRYLDAQRCLADHKQLRYALQVRQLAHRRALKPALDIGTLCFFRSNVRQLPRICHWRMKPRAP
jgi:hypothetical protein